MTDSQNDDNRQPLFDPNADVATNLQRMYEMMCERDRRSDEIASDRHNLLVNKFDNLERKYDALHAENAELSTKYDYLSGEMELLKMEMNEINQKLLSRNLVIRGIPEIENNSAQLNVLVQAVFFTLDVPPEYRRVSVAHRFGNKDEKKNTDRPILVRLVSEECKEAIINAKRGKKDLKSNMVIINGVALGTPEDDIYIQEQLTRHKSDLLASARKLKHDGLIQYAWTSNGDVLIREKKEGPVRKILHINQLNMIRNGSKSDESIDLAAGDGTNTLGSGQAKAAPVTNTSSGAVQAVISNGPNGGGSSGGTKPGKSSNKSAHGGVRKRKQNQEEGRNTRQRTAAAAALASLMTGS